MDIPAHLKSRGLQIERYQNVSWDEETACFRLFNFSGQTIGFQQYRPEADKHRKNDPKEGRYYTHTRRGELGVWGLETFYYRTDLLYVTEGVFDCCKLHNQELPAIAALACNPTHLKPWFDIIRATRTLIGVCDNDSAGELLAGSVDIALRLQDSKDLGDMTDNQVKEFLNATVRCF